MPLLFPGYVFALIVLQWHAARYAPGVASIIMSGDVPARVPDAVIAELRSREHNGLNRAANEAATGLTDRLSARRARAHSHRRLPRLFRTVAKTNRRTTGSAL
jgi:transcription antitermination factor NusG